MNTNENISDSDEDQDMDDNDEEKCEEQEQNMKILKEQLKKNPYYYDGHIQLIQSAKDLGELDDIRDARENMSKFYPLSSDLWLAWINDEKMLVETESDRSKIKELFERALKDYTSVSIWVEYCTFCCGEINNQGVTEKLRELFERGLIQVGLNVAEGSLLWENYREMEMLVLAQLQQDELSSVGNKSVQEKIKTQINKIDSLFKRQLRIPHKNMDITMAEYKEFLGTETTPVDADFQEAKKSLDEILHYEEQLETSRNENESALLTAYVNYLDFEMQKKDPSRIITLFQRAITDLCLHSEIWLKYFHYMRENVNFESRLLPQFERAVRNCPWSVQIWLEYAECMEEFNKDISDIRNVYEQALSSGLSEQSDLLNLWISYSDACRRSLDRLDHQEKEESLRYLRLVFQKGIEQLLQYFQRRGDPTCSLYRYWAYVEAKYGNNMEEARKLWTEVMKLGHGAEANMWIEYLNFEKRFGDDKHCRKILGRAVNSVTDEPDVVFDAYINYEREEGDYQSLKEAKVKVAAQSSRLAERRANAEASNKESNEKSKPSKKKHPQQERKQIKENKLDIKKEPMEDTSHLERKRFAQPSGDAPPVKQKKDNDGFAVPNLPGISTNQNVKQEANAEPTSKKELSKDSKTIFVSNLDFTVVEDQIKEALKECGEIKEVRLVRDYKNRSKGFGFIQFVTVAGRNACLKMDRMPLAGRPMYLSESDPDKRHDFQYKTTGIEKNKLFVKNLPKTITHHALETIFNQYGNVRDIRLVTYRNGQPKGHAYVEFENENDASKALIKTDNLLIGENHISVAISNPPPRNLPKTSLLNDFPSASANIPSLGSGKKSTTNAPRTQILMPRSLQSKSLISSTSSNSSKNNDSARSIASSDVANMTDSCRKSNDDFRKMFLK